MLRKHYNVSKNHNYCFIEMFNEDNKTLKYNHGEKSLTIFLLFMLT